MSPTQIPLIILLLKIINPRACISALMESLGNTCLLIPVNIQPEFVVDCFIKYVMPKFRPHWRKEYVKLSNKNFDGGYSNQIISIMQENSEEDIILFRINTDLQSTLFDREKEIQVMHLLSKTGMNPPVYANLVMLFAMGIHLDKH